MNLDKNTTFEIGNNLFLYNDDALLNADIKVIDRQGDKFRLLYNQKIYSALVKSFDMSKKTAIINVDGFDFAIKISEPIDKLINELGFLTATKHSVKEIKSPMPGLVVDVFVKIGESVTEGDKLLSLEAMKMENILKSPGNGTVKVISVCKGNTVDKNQILITFE